MPALEEFRPGPAVPVRCELVTAAGNVGTTIFHPVGTYPMGRADDAAVGLRVIDASIMTVPHP